MEWCPFFSKIDCKWSPDACTGYAKRHVLFSADEMVCTHTLYNEAWAGNLPIGIMELPEAVKRKHYQSAKPQNYIELHRKEHIIQVCGAVTNGVHDDRMQTIKEFRWLGTFPCSFVSDTTTVDATRGSWKKRILDALLPGHLLIACYNPL